MSERQNAGIHTLANKGAETWKKKKDKHKKNSNFFALVWENRKRSSK